MTPALSDKLAVVQQTIELCDRHDIPLFLEPIAYAPDPQHALTNSELLQIMLEMAQRFTVMGVDVLKLQFPVDVHQVNDEQVWRDACQALDAACGVPWALLSAGVDFATFAQQARIACECGASGVIAGRAIWKEAIQLSGPERQQFLESTVRQRMLELTSICRDYARPWFERISPPDGSVEWYERYSE
jgi:tagatose 1,6-diphosphate aldolase